MLIASNDRYDGIYTVGEELVAWVKFSERVRVTGTPRLKIQLDNGQHDFAPLELAYGFYAFRYRVPEGVSATQGISILSNSIDLNGGSIRDFAGNDAILNHLGTPADDGFIIDGIRPTVETLEITSSPGSDNIYEVGDVIEVSVTFDENVRVPNSSGIVYGVNYNWKPVLKLRVGEDHRTAYFAGVDQNVMKFSYEVSSGDYAPNGIAIPQNGLSRNQTHPTLDLAGAVIEDDVGNGRVGRTNRANLNHATLLSNSEHKVDARSGLPCTNEIIDNGTVSGSWAAGCNSQTRERRYARYYTFTLDTESVVTIDLQSSFNTYLYLRRGNDFRFGRAQYFHYNRDGTNTRISRSLRAGVWTIEATTAFIYRSGPFSVDITGLTEIKENSPKTTPLEPVVSVTAGSEVTEGGDASFTVTASPVPAADLDVSVTISASGDYGATTGQQTVTILPATGSATLTVATTGDDVDEPDGSVTATLDAPAADAGYTVSATQGAATVTVSDDDAPPTPEVSVTAGSGVNEGGDATFTITASPAPAANLDVSVTVSQTGDYGATTGQQTVTILPATGSATLTVATTGDDVDEPDGSVTATLDTPPADAGYTVSATQGVATVSVSDDDDPAPTPGYTVDPQVIAAVEYLASQTHHGTAHVNRWQRALVALGALDPAGVSGGALTLAEARQNANTYSSPVWDQVVAELEAKEAFEAAQQTPPPTPEVSITGASGGTEGQAVTFTVSANPAPAEDLAVSATVATLGDYGVTVGSRTVTIAADTTSKTLTLQTTDDATDEADGSVTLTLNGGSGYTVSASQGAATVSVADDDPVVSISGGSGVTEGGDASFTVTASPIPAANLDVSVTVSQSGDYGATTGQQTVTILAATGSATLTVSTTNDDADEADGSVTATLDTPPADAGYTVSATQGVATVSVSDDDDPAPTPGYTVDPDVIAAVEYLASQTHHGTAHVNRWQRALAALGALDPAGVSGSALTLVEARQNANAYSSPVWDQVVAELEAKEAFEAAQQTPPPTPEVSITSASGGTEGQAVTFTVSANPAPAEDLAVSVTVATSGDYGVTAGSRTVTIAADTTSKTLTLQTTDDSTDEADGSVTLTLDDGSGYTLGQVSSEAAQVQDDDDAPPPQQQQPVVSISGGGGVTEGGDASFTITASPEPASPITVNVTVSASGDYGATTGSRTVTVTTTGSAILTVGTTDDGNDEADGSVTATLVDGADYDLGTNQAATVSVADDDVPVVSISGGGGVTEGGDASFTITASPVPAADLTVNVTVSASGDYGATTGSRTVTVPATGSAILTVGTTDDGNDEADGSVTATMNAGDGYAVSSSQGAATVIVSDDDDAPQQPVVSISGGSGVTEGGDASFTITASPVPAADLSVSVTVSASGDYGATTGSRTVTIPATGSAILTVGTTDDGNDEADGSVTATLVDGADYDLGTNRAATVSVADDDVPVVSISGGGGVTEGGDASFTITASPVPAADLTVNVAVTASGDYGATTGSRTVTVPATGSAILTVGTTDDGNDEADGSVTATVNAGDGYAVSSSQGAATVSVSDDDDAPTSETAVTISIEDASASENDTDLVFRVTLSEASNEDVTVQWATSHSQSPDRARGGQGYDYDFWHAVGEIVIRAGETSGKGAVWLNQDSKDEPDEVFTVTLSSPVGATLERDEGTMTIIDDD